MSDSLGTVVGLESKDRAVLADLTDRDLDRLMVLGKISRTINESRNLDEVLGRVLDIVIDAMGAERGLVLLDRGGEELEVVVARGTQAGPLLYSKQVAQVVMATARPLVSLDVTLDAALSPSESLHLLGTRSILCVPLTINSRTIGLLYLDSRVRTNIFTSIQLHLAVVIADLAATAIERSEYFTALLQSEKMALVGNMLATIAHELNNPLGSIYGCVDLLRLGGGHDPEVIAILESESKRCRNLIQTLLRLSRKDTDVRPIDLAEIVRQAIAVVTKDFERQGLTLDFTVDGTNPPVLGNADQLVQVVLNLLKNASQALRDVPEPCIRLTLSTRPGLAFLCVSDNGPGVAPENLRRIFEPFFTTKPADQGTGIGLALVERIVKDHDGKISVESKPEKGAMFRIELPVAPPDPDL